MNPMYSVVRGDGECSICTNIYQPDNPAVKLTCCGQVLHETCLLTGIFSGRNECPFCNRCITDLGEEVRRFNTEQRNRAAVFETLVNEVSQELQNSLIGLASGTTTPDDFVTRFLRATAQHERALHGPIFQGLMTRYAEGVLPEETIGALYDCFAGRTPEQAVAEGPANPRTLPPARRHRPAVRDANHHVQGGRGSLCFRVAVIVTASVVAALASLLVLKSKP